MFLQGLAGVGLEDLVGSPDCVVDTFVCQEVTTGANRRNDIAN